MSLTQVILDPKEVAAEGRIELALKPLIGEEGIDWGDKAVKAFMSEGQIGEPMVDYTIPNRTIKIPLVIKAGEGVSFDDWRVKLEAKVAKINEEGGWLKRIHSSGRYVYADLVEAKLHLGGDWMVENKELDKLATLELQAYPDFYGAAVETTAFEGTGDASTTIQVKGNLPARVDLTVTEKSGNEQFGLMYHFRARHYSSASTAAWRYEAEALGIKTGAESKALTGASGGNAVLHNNLGTTWTPILGTNIGGTEYLTHVGLYNVWARVYTKSTLATWLRFAYGVGDLVTPDEMSPVRIPGIEAFYMLKLGQINLQKKPLGPHRWEGLIQGRGEEAGQNAYIDRLYFECVDECAGECVGVQKLIVGTKIAAKDSFLQTSGTLATKKADTGQEWTGAGDGGDFSVVE